MDILHINKFHYYRDGASNVYLRTAHLLEEHGHRPLFFSMNDFENTLPCDTGEYFLPYIDFSSRNISMAKKLQIAGRFLYSFEAKRKLSMMLDKYPVDIAHIHNIYHHFSPSILHVLKKRNIPMVMTLHDYKLFCASYSMLAGNRICEDCSERRYYNVIKRRCVKDSLVKSALSALEMYLHHNILNIYDNIDIFISPSIFLRNKLIEKGIKKEIIYLPNFIDVTMFDGFTSGADDNGQDKENSIVYFGRISEEKGLWTLMNTARIISRKKNMDIRFKLIGEGAFKKRLLEKVKTEGIGNVRFFDHMSGEVLYREVKKSMIVVLPSEWYENNPLTVIEAFTMSIPVIGSRIGGIPELVKDGVTGLTFEAGNSEDLAARIEYLMNNPDKIAEMGRNAKAYVKEELNSEKHYKKLMEIYGMAISKKQEKTRGK